MARRLSITVLVLVCFFAICHAKVPLDLPEEGAVNDEDPSVTLAESDVKSTILLPSEKPESEPATTVEVSESDDSVPESDIDFNSVAETEDMDPEEVKRPLTFVTFRSVNHRFPFRPFFLGGHHRHHHHPREISYGNDMIHSEESDEIHHQQQPREIGYGNDEMLNEESDEIHHYHHHHHHHQQPREMGFGSGMMFHDRDGGPRDFPMRWTRFRRVGGMPRFGFRGEEGMMMRKHFHRHGEDEEPRRGGGCHHKHFHHEDEEEKRERDEKEGGVMMRFRKFLNRF